MKSSNATTKNHDVRAIKQMIADDLGISGLTKSQQDDIIAQLNDTISLKVTLVAWKSLSKEDKDEFKKAVQRGDKKTLDNLPLYIENFYQTVESITKQTVQDFKKKKARV